MDNKVNTPVQFVLAAYFPTTNTIYHTQQHPFSFVYFTLRFCHNTKFHRKILCSLQLLFRLFHPSSNLSQRTDPSSKSIQARDEVLKSVALILGCFLHIPFVSSPTASSVAISMATVSN